MKQKIKKTVCAVLCACLSAATLVPAFAATMGDLTGDEAVAAEDARAILRAAVGLDALTAADEAKADMDCDGNVTAADARLALRTAVGLEQTSNAVYENQYDILRSGRFYAELETGDVDDAQLSFAADGEKQYFSGGMEGVNFSMVIEGDSLTFLNPNYMIYSSLTQKQLEMLGGDEGLFPDFSEITGMLGDFDTLPPLSEANTVREETLNGTPCIVYTFLNGDKTTKVYMEGKKLLELAQVDSRGRVEAPVLFASVRAVIPTEVFGFRKIYTEIPDFFNYMIISFNGLDDSLPALSEAEIRQIIEESKNA